MPAPCRVQPRKVALSSTFVGVVHGVGNARGDIEKDPSLPLLRARDLGRDLFTRHATDYQIDTPRPAKVWL